MGNRLSASSVEMLPQLHFIAIHDTKSKHFSNTLRDSSVYIISCIRQPVAQELNKIYFLVYMRASSVDLLREARNFDRGANKSQVSTFDYLMPLVFEASAMKCAFFWRLFLNDRFSQFFHFSSLMYVADTLWSVHTVYETPVC